MCLVVNFLLLHKFVPHPPSDVTPIQGVPYMASGEPRKAQKNTRRTRFPAPGYHVVSCCFRLQDLCFQVKEQDTI